jgi:hypothetical protein
MMREERMTREKRMMRRETREERMTREERVREKRMTRETELIRRFDEDRGSILPCPCFRRPASGVGGEIAGSFGRWSRCSTLHAGAGTQDAAGGFHAREEDSCVVDGLEEQEDEHEQVQDACSSHDSPKHRVRPVRECTFRTNRI